MKLTTYLHYRRGQENANLYIYLLPHTSHVVISLLSKETTLPFYRTYLDNNNAARKLTSILNIQKKVPFADV
jgi:hypothetical protein